MSINVKGLTKFYGAQRALDDVSFQVGVGEIVGLLGPNGAGKSTCMKILSGYMQDYEGTALVGKVAVRRDPLATKSKVGYLPENNPLYLDMYVREFLTFVARVHHMSGDKGQLDELLEMVGLELESHKKIRSLSKGYRQRVGLAQALIHDPTVLILDEPTSGLDPNQLGEIRQLIRQLGQNKTVLFSSHILAEVEELCDRVVMLDRGQLVADEKLGIRQDIQRIHLQLDTNVGVNFFSPLQPLEVSIMDGNEVTLTFVASQDHRKDIFDLVVANGCRILSMQEIQQSLRHLFSEYTNTNKS